ncbi:MAG: RHS repeat-associated core domain-containing protein [Bacteroidales bacterium]|jgi:RHS repeat-associated protein|nr:RHS repeat-associated core domain-containing protein [Bacteroidales bacterium]
MTILRTFHHPDHLGSSSWITYNTGQPIQHLHYLPFGEDWVDQRNSSWNAPYTFSGKEKDVETGYGYFGARYYDSGLSIWLSVDPMSDKYPSMSPYNYCANNPVILVDPDGREVFLLGELASVAYNQLVNRAQNLNFSFDEKTGKISANVKEGAKLSKTEKHLLKAINDKNSKVNIQTVKAGQGETTFEIDGRIRSNGGSFMGTVLIESGENVKASSTNMVDPNLLANLDTKECGSVGTNLIHEITEGFEACQKTIIDKKPICSPLLDRTGYDIVHGRATNQSWCTDRQLQLKEQYKSLINFSPLKHR